MEKIGSFCVLNDDYENWKFVLKLLKWVSNCWSCFVFNWKEENKVFFFFLEFVKFVVKEVDIVCDFVLFLLFFNEEDSGRIISERNKDKKLRFFRRFCDVIVFVISYEEKNGIVESRLFCFYCKKFYDLDICLEFVKKIISERKEFVLVKGFCFGCL